MFLAALMDFTVVSTDWLNAEINKGNSDNLAVLDATWFSNKMTARDEFSRYRSKYVESAYHRIFSFERNCVLRH